jgi:putative FmdB family regulatory protein
MALYEYRCGSCGKTFEVMQKFSDAPLEIHENCGGALEKLVSASAIKFKGSGFYVNDYARGKPRGGGNGKDTKPESNSETKSESKSESKTESKTEAKTESKPASKPASDKK